MLNYILLFFFFRANKKIFEGSYKTGNPPSAFENTSVFLGPIELRPLGCIYGDKDDFSRVFLFRYYCSLVARHVYIVFRGPRRANGRAWDIYSN